MPAPPPPPPPPAAKPPPFPITPPSTPIDLLTGEPVIILSAGSQTYTATTTPSYIFGNTGSDTIEGGSSFESTVDYSALHAGVTLGVGGTVTKGLNGALGTDTLVDIKTIVGAAGQNNVIDASSATGAISVDLNAHTIGITGIPVIGSLSFDIYNFETVDGPALADTFVGDNGNDVFVGGAGSTFTTGTGTNTLTGGGSHDTYIVNGGHDTITDFSISGGDVVKSQTALEAITAIKGGSVLHFQGGGTVTLLGIGAGSLTNTGAIQIT